MSKFNSAWYVVYTKPNQEKKLATQLSERKIKYLFPTTKVLRQWHDRKKWIDLPFFPSYIFVRMDSMTDYIYCSEMNGFSYFVKFGNQLAVITDKTIADIDLIVSKGMNVEVSSGNVLPGQKVNINKGPFSGQECEVVEYKGGQKICVRVNLLNRNILTDLQSTNIA